MSDSLFNLDTIRSWIGAELVAPTGKSISDAAGIRVEHLSGLKQSRPGSLAFFFSKEFIGDLQSAQPTVLLTAAPFYEGLKAHGHPILKTSWLLICKDPYWAMALLTAKFAEQGLDPTFKKVESFRHETAVIDPSAKLGDSIWIGPYVVIGKNAKIGSGTRLEARVVIGDDVQVGERCHFFPGVTIYPGMTIGNQCRFHSGAVIGADGFGYAPVIQDGLPVAHQKIYHFGKVRIGNDVEIGANSCIDRGTLDDTIIEDQVKIDNHVQIGHNCHMKKGSVICGSAGMAGSSTLGEFAYVGGLTGVSNKVVIGNYAKIGAMSIVTKDVADHDMAAGNPQRAYKDFFKVNAWLNKQVLRGKKNEQ